MSRSGSRADHHRFCKIEGWAEVQNARGTAVGHHITFELALSDSRILRSRISRPADGTAYGTGLWKAILKDQLCVSEAEFWTCVTDRLPPVRGVEPPPDPATRITRLARRSADQGGRYPGVTGGAADAGGSGGSDDGALVQAEVTRNE